MGKKVLFFMLACLLHAGGFVYSQVGVNTEQPHKLTELHVKNRVEGTDTIPKGIMIPRLTEEQRNAMDVSDADEVNSLMIYNIDEDCYNYYSRTEGEWQSLCGKMGKAHFEVNCGSIQVQGVYGDGVALNTSNYIKVSVNVLKMGSYSISATANPDNGYFYELSGTFYSTGPITLTIPGTGQPVNHTQGTDILDDGDDTPDQFTLASNSTGDDCDFEVNVRSTAACPKFTIDCKSTVVEGMYFEDELLSSVPNLINKESHRIKVVLKGIPAEAYGAVASLQTNEVDGFSFKGEAVLSASSQTIYLDGTGTPRGLNDKVFTITSNSETSNASCNVTVYMLIPRKRLLTVGLDHAAYGYNLGQPTSRDNVTTGYTSGNDMLTDKNNFGYNQWSIVKFAGFSNKSAATTANLVPNASVNSWVDDDRDIICLYTAGWQNMTGATLEGLLKGTNGKPKIDIVMIGHDTAEYFRNNNQADSDKADALIEFVKTGGILMICSERPISNGNFMKKFFGVSNITSVDGLANNPAGSLYTLGFDPDNLPSSMRSYYCKDNDPILAGPFEDISGRVWGEDSSTTTYLNDLPLEEIIIYSGARPIGYTGTANPVTGVTVFRHRDYPLVFVGDGGFNSNEVKTYLGLTACPFRLGTKTINGKTYNHYPVVRNHFGPSEAKAGNVYNSVFTANAFAWCILKAEEYRRENK